MAEQTIEEEEEEPKDLATLTAEANHQYAIKNYAGAAELYSRATALQAEQNGEMAPENADLLYSYGRCLYKVAAAKSDVLGDKVAGDGGGQSGATDGKKRKRGAENVKIEKDSTTTNVLGKAVQAKDGSAGMSLQDAATAPKQDQSKPFFQISGDDAEWDSDSDEKDAEGDDAAEGDEGDEEDDDFATAYEILDLARLLLAAKLEAFRAAQTSPQNKGKEKATESPEERKLMERLADTYDLQTEINLENERFVDAVSDSRSSLQLKQILFPMESSLVAESHFKLSLALEYASVTTTKDATAAPGSLGADDTAGEVDMVLRGEAAEQMKLAMESTRARVAAEKVTLSTVDGEAAKSKQKAISDVEELLVDMEQRLEELNSTAQPLSAAALLGPAGAGDASEMLGGVLGSVMGASAAEQKKRIDAAVQGANDLSGFVKHKKKPKDPIEAVEAGATNGGKRKAGDNDTQDNSGKRAKTEELQ